MTRTINFGFSDILAGMPILLLLFMLLTCVGDAHGSNTDRAPTVSAYLYAMADKCSGNLKGNTPGTSVLADFSIDEDGKVVKITAKDGNGSSPATPQIIAEVKQNILDEQPFQAPVPPDNLRFPIQFKMLFKFVKPEKIHVLASTTYGGKTLAVTWDK